MVEAVIGLGSNLGDRLNHLQNGITGLTRSGCDVVALSSVFETAPVGPTQPAYLNAVVVIETSLSPQELMTVCLNIEEELGRERLVKWGPRTLDMDVLDIAGISSADDYIRVPHPLSHERGFVLVPWAQVRPAWVHPAVGKSVGELAAAVNVAGEGIVRRDDLVLGISH